MITHDRLAVRRRDSESAPSMARRGRRGPAMADPLWPAVVAPDAMAYARGGGLLGGLAVLLWWAFFSRAPLLERWGVVVLIAAAFADTPAILHKSIASGRFVDKSDVRRRIGIVARQRPVQRVVRVHRHHPARILRRRQVAVRVLLVADRPAFRVGGARQPPQRIVVEASRRFDLRHRFQVSRHIR